MGAPGQGDRKQGRACAAGGRAGRSPGAAAPAAGAGAPTGRGDRSPLPLPHPDTRCHRARTARSADRRRPQATRDDRRLVLDLTIGLARVGHVSSQENRDEITKSTAGIVTPVCDDCFTTLDLPDNCIVSLVFTPGCGGAFSLLALNLLPLLVALGVVEMLLGNVPPQYNI